MIKALITYLKDKSGVTENRQRLAQLEEKVGQQHNFLLSLQQLTATETWVINPKLATAVQQNLQETHALKSFSTAVHKNDVMLAYHLYKTAPNVFWGLQSYFEVGIKAVQALAVLADEQGWQPQKILDFGSGYGRMSRFLPQFFTAEIIPSEVKEEAITFQKKQFGFKGFAHSPQAEDFKTQPVDLIIALSVFTHLPQNAAFSWLKKLMTCLGSKAPLVFTYHALEEQAHLWAQNQAHVFQHNSEDSLLPITDDYLENTQEYGVSFFGQAHLEAFFKEQGWQFKFLNNRLAKNQKAFALWKN
jgi:2-polyprenyl-3-methyl-5-hydroxy-6-metoxy-1,4-benzoquinol methylase